MAESSLQRRKEALDNALLFLSSAIPFGFSLLTLALGLPFSGLITLSPILIFAILLPLYVGYLRGVVELDSLGERARGWVYLVCGSGFYSILIITSQLNRISWFAESPLSVVVWFTSYWGLFWLTRRFVRWMYRAMGQASIPVRDGIGIASTVAAQPLAAAAFFIIGTGGGLLVPLAIPASPEVAISSVMTASLFVLPLLLIESNCHRYLDLAARMLRPRPVSHSRIKAMERFGTEMERYMDYTVALLLAGRHHRIQYAVMLLGYAVTFLGAASSYQTATSGTVIVGIGDVIFFGGLIWHIIAPS